MHFMATSRMCIFGEIFAPRSYEEMSPTFPALPLSNWRGWTQAKQNPNGTGLFDCFDCHPLQGHGADPLFLATHLHASFVALGTSSH